MLPPTLIIVLKSIRISFLITAAYSKKVMGYDLSDSLATNSSIRALKMALKKRAYPTISLIHHSDRGFQYCSELYQKHLNNAHIRTSMTESYDPYANTVAERMNGILKQEFLFNTPNQPLKVMQKLVEQAIKIYNHERPHWSCKMLTPERTHQQKAMRIKTYKSKRLRKNVLSEPL